jgi:hypothetical protein
MPTIGRLGSSLGVLGVSLVLALFSPGAGAIERTVILVSLDGTTPAMLDALPTLRALARRGTSAERLTPVFPSNTFPNHATLVTGVVPDRHGIVNNAFIDPERGLFRYDGDPSWFQAEPLWSIVGRSKVVSAAFHWVGSEGAWRSGLGPRHRKPFDASTPEVEKVDRILAWLDLADARARPRLVTSWFRGADAAGHHHGPDAPEVARALAPQERALARLVSGLEARGAWASTALLVVSDHGMARVQAAVDVQSALALAGVPGEVIGAGGFATIVLDDPGADRGRAIATVRALGLRGFAVGDHAAPYPITNPRFGDVAVLAPPGTAIQHEGKASRGSHGHAPDSPSMGGVFVAAGAGVPIGLRLAEVRAVDVAPTVLGLLGVTVPAGLDGRPIPRFAGAGDAAPQD